MNQRLYTKPFGALGMGDSAHHGGKTCSLSEMSTELREAGVPVPPGFGLDDRASLLHQENEAIDGPLTERMATVDVEDVPALRSLSEGMQSLVRGPKLPDAVRLDVDGELLDVFGLNPPFTFAVRSSAPDEDGDASFAGQHRSHMNIPPGQQMYDAIQDVWASALNAEAISYRVRNRLMRERLSMAVTIMRMVQTDEGAAGVGFSNEPDSGHPDIMKITGCWGHGERIVSGHCPEDEADTWYISKSALVAGKNPIVRRVLGHKKRMLVFNPAGGLMEVDVPAEKQRRFCLTDEKVVELATYIFKIEVHYKKPMDIEWAQDGKTIEMFIVQARPETVASRHDPNVVHVYQLTGTGETLSSGAAVGSKIGHGAALLLRSPDEFTPPGVPFVLIAERTTPAWEPVMKKAAAIVTADGTRVCHAAIVSRELGLPCIVGARNIMSAVQNGQMITVCCSEGDIGNVYEGEVPFRTEEFRLDSLPKVPVKFMVNLGDPNQALKVSRLPVDGVGLARMELIIANAIGVHPLACINYASESRRLRAAVRERFEAAGFTDPVEFYVRTLAESIAIIAAAFFPRLVILRFSDFKTEEYRLLIGGDKYEEHEGNPMLGFRGARRYISESFGPAFQLELEAVRRVREGMGLTNLSVMVPFVRTLQEGQAALSLLSEVGLHSGENDLRIMMMCEVPSNVILAEQFLSLGFDGFSIGSNDLTQLTLGVDRDTASVAPAFNELDDAVLWGFRRAIATAHAAGKYVGICGQLPSDKPEGAQWLVREGIDSMSLTPDSLLPTWRAIGEIAQQ